MRLTTSSGDRPGEDARTSAASPATSGEAIEVPAQAPVPPPGTLLTIPSPGAITVGQPRSENADSASLWLLAPTEISPFAFSAAGYIERVELWLPAATATTAGCAGGATGVGSSLSIPLSPHASPMICRRMPDL